MVKNTYISNTTGGFRWFFVNIVCALLCFDVLLLLRNGLETQPSDQSVVKKKKKEKEMNPFILINHLFYVKILIKKIGTNQNQLTENVFFFANRVSFAAEKKKTHRL